MRCATRTLIGLACFTSVAAACSTADRPNLDASATQSDGSAVAPLDNPLPSVSLWAYQIDSLEVSGAVDKLVASHYDMVVVDPTRTDSRLATFDAKGMVRRLQESTGRWGKRKLAMAYVDIGEAESWRYYWQQTWKRPTADATGTPDFLITTDPDGWKDNFPVAYWDPAWKAILFGGSGSLLQQVIDDGFDGIYMDWVEAYQNDRVIAAAVRAGKDPAVEMIKLIEEIGTYLRKQRPKFLVIAQNGAALYQGHTEYFKLIDAIAQEQIYFDGKADTDWSDPLACDKPLPATGPFSSEYYETLLKAYKAQDLPIFHVEYACKTENVATAYERGAQNGFLGYVSRRPLDQLTSAPPPGY